MNPYFFGSSARPLYGVHHPPRAREGAARGVVLCYPFGQEYMRGHRAFRQLANLLSRQGWHVLRFDYSGTGDSAGAGTEARAEEWLEDVGQAVDELKDAAGLRQVTLIGLRLGAALATVATAHRNDIDRLILWDPVLRGADYLAEILEAVGVPAGGESGVAGITGFPLTPELHRGIASLDLTALGPPPASRVYLVTAQERAEVRSHARALAAAGAVVTDACVPSPGSWNEVDFFGSALVPQAIIRTIVGWLTEEER